MFKRVSHILLSAGAVVAIACLATPLQTHAQDYPVSGRPIKVVVPTAAGGGNDVMARIVAQKLSQRMNGHSVIVDNIPGANGAIGSGNVARAKPDGYTILFGYIATHGINPGLSKLPYDAIKDFSPITLVAEAPEALVVHPSVPAKTVKELIAVAKAKPGSLSYASAGNGTAPHVSGELFKMMTGTDLVHVPYKGSAPAMTDTLAGHTQVMFPSLVAAGSYMKSGKLRALAVTGKKRSALFPELPTVDESGVAGFEITQWYGFFAPAKTPKEIVDKLHSEIVAVMKEPDVAKKFAEHGADVVTNSPEEFGKFVQAEIAKWSKVIKTAKITAD
jgi:tripartite-type tricarboxylate transporter receptor subunit TctC